VHAVGDRDAALCVDALDIVQGIRGGLSATPRWLPREIRWQNYPEALTALPFARMYLNTTIITVTATIGQLLSASMAGFGFARLRAPGRDLLFGLLISTMLLPEQVTMIPQFIIFRTLGMVDTWAPLIVPSWLGVYAFYIFLCRQFFMTLPRELDEAAKIDGASYFTIYWRILLPLSKPVLASVGVFSFLNRWCERRRKNGPDVGIKSHRVVATTAG